MNSNFCLGNWLVCPKRHCIKRGAETVRLKPKAMAVLVSLAEADGEVVTRQEFFDAIWPNSVVSDATLSQCVVELRQAFGESAKHARIIKTIPKVGFRLIPAVVPMDGSSTTKSIAAALAGNEPKITNKFKSPQLLLTICMLLAVLVFTAYTNNRADKASPAIGGGAKSIAVLPFTNIAAEPDREYFVEGIQEALITELSKIESLSVISRTSTRKFRDSDKSVPTIANELGVAFILEGSVLHDGDMVRITTQLIEGRSDRHIWADSYDRKLIDILALYSEITHKIALQISVTLTPKDQSRLETFGSVNPVAYDLYLKALHHLDMWNPQDMIKGVNLMREVVRLEPDSALANAGLALALQWTSWFDYIPAVEIMHEARTAALYAVELDEKLAQTHAALGAVYYYLEFNYHSARKALEKAHELNSGDAKTLIELSWLLGESGQFEQAIELAEQAIKLDPLSTVAHGALGQVYYLARDFEQAKKHYAQALVLNRSDPSTYYFLAWTYEQLGEYQRAIELHKTAVRLSGSAPIFLSGLGYALAKAGRQEEAEGVLGDLKIQMEEGAVAPIYVAEVHIGLEQLDQAMDLIEQAFRARNSHVMYINKGSRFDPLRENPRFQALIDEIWEHTE